MTMTDIPTPTAASYGLVGFSLGWTELDASEMQSFRSRRKKPSKDSSALDTSA